MRVKSFAAVLVSGLAMAAATFPAGSAEKKMPISLQTMGSFHVGGKIVEITGQPTREVVFSPGGVPAKVDPNGQYMVGQMYVQYFVPTPKRGSYPLLMWHGGGLTGVTWETTPDGREGFSTYFLRKGWPVYVSDAVERGRSGFAPPQVMQADPLFLTIANPFERFRIGEGAGSWNDDPAKRKVRPGDQFPVDAYMQFVKQVVPRWTTTDPMINAAYVDLLDKVGPSVVMVHSQAGQFGLMAAESRPDKVRALILLEPAGLGDPEQVAKLKNVPILAVFGDYIEQDARWPKIRQNAYDFFDKIRAAGGKVDVVNLPQIGIRGNSHMLMMDKNSDQVAGVVQDWLAKQKVWK
jgi:pimeloyl-ACP methyl ester carboxylesterase